MSYIQLRSFNAVVEKKGVTAAARFLNVSQSAVTSQVRELERRYNVELFHRKGRSIVPTEAGESLYKLTKRLIQAHADSMDYLSASKALETGCLRIAAVGPFHAIEMASSFKVKYPGISVEMQFGNSQETLESLQSLEADIAILAAATENSNIVMKHYSKHKVVVFVNRYHRFFDRDSVKLAELQDENFILREKGSTTRQAFDNALSLHGVTVNNVMEIGSREGVWKAVSLGLGIGVVADFEFVSTPELIPKALIFDSAAVSKRPVL